MRRREPAEAQYTTKIVKKEEAADEFGKLRADGALKVMIDNPVGLGYDM